MHKIKQSEAEKVPNAEWCFQSGQIHDFDSKSNAKAGYYMGCISKMGAIVQKEQLKAVEYLKTQTHKVLRSSPEPLV
jgi:hypothetical protein